MSYLTNSDIETRMGTARYVQLTDDAGTGSADLAVVAEARDGAERELDSYLARRYAVPIDTATNPELAALLKSVALDLVEHRLHARRPPLPTDVAAKRADAIAWLARIASGEIELPSATALAPNRAKGLSAAAVGDTRVLSRRELSGF